MRILFVISDLTYGGSAKQLTLLASRLPPERFHRRVCVLGAAGPWAETLREAGVVVDVLNRRWPFDLPAFNRLWHALRAYQADVLHVWGQSALRAVALAGGLRKGRLFVTRPLPSRRPFGRLPWQDRWLLRAAERVTVPSQAAAEEWRRFGLEDCRVCAVPPGVTAVTQMRAGAPARLPPRTILCVGPLHRHKGFRDAIWVLDMLRFLHADLQLAFVGEGPDRPALERFASVARVSDRVHFLGHRTDVPALLAEAELLWAPGRVESGVNAILEAMAAGTPVVASDLPGAREVVADGETGFLVPPADQAALARKTRVLLDDPDLRRRMGEAGTQRVLERFPASAMIERFAALYEPA
jgi:glycosyltransferase involved in cell wall biosynthesis